MNAKLVFDNNGNLVLFQFPVEGPGGAEPPPIGIAVLMDGSGHGYLTSRTRKNDPVIGPCITWFGPGERFANAHDAIEAVRRC